MLIYIICILALTQNTIMYNRIVFAHARMQISKKYFHYVVAFCLILFIRINDEKKLFVYSKIKFNIMIIKLFRQN